MMFLKKMTKVRYFQQLSLLLMLIFSLNFYIHSRIFCNGSGGVYGEGGGDSLYSISETSIENLVISGAGYYLDSYSYFLAFLNRVEVAGDPGFVTPEWPSLVKRALYNINLAVLTYEELVRTAEKTPYNETAILALKKFDYTGYMLDQDLNNVIFKDVESYLVRGDVTGMYKKMLADLRVIRTSLQGIYNSVFYYNMPALSQLWRLNELYSRNLTFGRYVAMIFAAIAV